MFFVFLWILDFDFWKIQPIIFFKSEENRRTWCSFNDLEIAFTSNGTKKVNVQTSGTTSTSFSLLEMQPIEKNKTFQSWSKLLSYFSLWSWISFNNWD